jgi:undecaprenyl-diphosphatase
MGAFERFEREVLFQVTCRLHAPWLGDALLFLQEWEVAMAFLALGVLVVGFRSRLLALRTLATSGIAVGLALGFGSLTWLVVERPRPQKAYEEVLTTPDQWATCASHPDALVLRTSGSRRPSFPSHHALTAGALAAVLWIAWRPLGAVAWLYGLLVAWARLYSGKHWPSDVLAGLVLGALIGWGAWWAATPLHRRVEARLGGRSGRPRAPSAEEGRG